MLTKETTILVSVKNFLGILPATVSSSFDDPLLLLCSAAVAKLDQMGVTARTFAITSSSTFAQIFGTTSESGLAIDYTDRQYALIEQFLDIYVKNQFDPPQNGTLNNALAAVLNEAEWRIYSEFNLTGEEE